MKLRRVEPGLYEAHSGTKHFIVKRTTTGGYVRSGTGREAVDVKVPLNILWKVYLNGNRVTNFLTLPAARRWIAEQE